MGLIRGGLFIFVSILLFISIIVGGVLLILSLSLNYDNVNTHAKEIIKQGNINENNIEQNINVDYPSMLSKCENASTISYSSGDYDLDIPCSIVNESSQAVVDYGIDMATKEFYYKKYDCNLFDCMDKSPNSAFVLISKHAKSYWINKFFISLLVSLILLTGLFFLAHKKNNFFIFSGLILILSGFILINVEAILFPVIKSAIGISSEQSELLLPGMIDSFIGLFFSQSWFVFWIYFIIGLIFVITGILIKLWNVSYGLSKFFGIWKTANTTSKVKALEKELDEAEDEIKKIKKKK